MFDLKSKIQQPYVTLSEAETSKSVDTPRLYNLQEACERFFPNTAVQPCDLLSLAKKKKLRLTRMGKIKLVTSEAIRDMIELCQERKVHHDSGSKREQGEKPFGASSMPDAKLALAALNQELSKLQANSRRTSQKIEKLPENAKPRKS